MVIQSSFMYFSGNKYGTYLISKKNYNSIQDKESKKFNTHTHKAKKNKNKKIFKTFHRLKIKPIA